MNRSPNATATAARAPIREHGLARQGLGQVARTINQDFPDPGNVQASLGEEVG